MGRMYVGSLEPPSEKNAIGTTIQHTAIRMPGDSRQVLNAPINPSRKASTGE